MTPRIVWWYPGDPEKGYYGW